MIINPSYKIELIDVIETAPDECFKAPADITRANLLNDKDSLEAASIEFQKDVEYYCYDYDWSMGEALKRLGLIKLPDEVQEEQETVQRYTAAIHQYVAVIAPEYVRNAEIYDRSYEEDVDDDYFYDDSRWQETSNAEIFIGIFQTSKYPDADVLREIRIEAVVAANNNGLCKILSIDAIKLIEI